MQDISSIVQGKLMLRTPKLLASLLTITFISIGQLPKSWIHLIFWVCRKIILDTLLWLKENNLKYYSDIEISTSQIDNLPEDDMPDEIASIICQSDDISIINQESEGYVPLDNNKLDQLCCDLTWHADLTYTC